MTKHLLVFGQAIAFFGACVCTAQVPGTGRIHVDQIHSYSGTSSLTKPTSIVVYNFATTPEEVRLNRAVLNRVRMKVSGGADDEKTKLAKKIADEFSEALVKDLQKSGIPVSRGVEGDLPPEGSLAVQGDFLQIDEGNRTRRMVIGLGAGSSKVVAHVECYLREPARNNVLSEFKVTSESSRKPGAAETMGAGAAPAVAGAVSGATELKQEAEGDTDRMAKAVAKQIKKALTAQGWVEESK
jgi:hypothetical protein